MPRSSDSHLTEKISAERDKIKHMLRGFTKSLKHSIERNHNDSDHHRRRDNSSDRHGHGRHGHHKKQHGQKRRKRDKFNEIQARIQALNCRRCVAVNIRNENIGCPDPCVIKRNLDTYFENQN